MADFVHVEYYMHSGCNFCPYYDECFAKVVFRKQVLKLMTRQLKTSLPRVCNSKVLFWYGGIKEGVFLVHIKEIMQYSKSLQVMFVAFHTFDSVSSNCIHKILSSVFNILLLSSLRI